MEHMKLSLMLHVHIHIDANMLFHCTKQNTDAFHKGLKRIWELKRIWDTMFCMISLTCDFLRHFIEPRCFIWILLKTFWALQPNYRSIFSSVNVNCTSCKKMDSFTLLYEQLYKNFIEMESISIHMTCNRL